MNYFEKILILDGAMGTELVKRNAPMGKLPEELNITNPEIVKDVHKSYLLSGSDVIYTCSFGANGYKAKESRFSVEELVSASVKNAKEAINETKKSALVALSMGTIGDILEPYGNLKFAEAYEYYREMVVAGEKAGADALVFETQTDLLEVKAGVLAAKENTSLPVWVTMTFEKSGRTFTGTDVRSMAVTLEGLGVEAVGVNCSLGPKDLYELVKSIRSVSALPIIVKPNAGLPDPKTGKYNLLPGDFAEEMKAFVDMGVSMIGGCCGTSPEYIKELVNITKDKKPTTPEKVYASYLSSGREVVDINKITVAGERINPTGKKKFQEALKNQDIDYIKGMAFEQVECGAKVLDVNVGFPGIDEKALMLRVVKELQGIVDTPLMIDSSDPEVIEAALRHYNGKALVNSVNGEDSVLDSVLPLAKKYGAAVVGLSMNSEGIPEEASKRVEIAGHIVEKCKEYGIEPKDIYIDCLTLTVAAQQKEARGTLKAIKEVKERFGVRTVLGVSNISFGLPMREFINTTFLTLAMEAGLDLAIMNPNNAAMMGAVDSYLVLDCIDDKALLYAEKYAPMQEEMKKKKAVTVTSVEAGVSKKDSEDELTEHVLKGLKDFVAADVNVLLEKEEPLCVVNEKLIPALDKVGEEFEKGHLFLPQLLAAASAAEAGFDVIKERLSLKNDSTSISKGRIILATVQGDVHDIGKNIVKTILENYGFSVIDLGKDVAPELVVETARKENIKLIGLSALMTTTVKAMAETIRQVKEAGLDCKIMVGGAVLTKEYAMEIGADYYSKDAKQSADIAKEVFEK